MDVSPSNPPSQEQCLWLIKKPSLYETINLKNSENAKTNLKNDTTKYDKTVTYQTLEAVDWDDLFKREREKKPKWYQDANEITRISNAQNDDLNADDNEMYDYREGTKGVDHIDYNLRKKELFHQNATTRELQEEKENSRNETTNENDNKSENGGMYKEILELVKQPEDPTLKKVFSVKAEDFPEDCWIAYERYQNSQYGPNPDEVEHVFKCGPDVLLSTGDYMVFKFPKETFEYIYKNFDVLDESSPSPASSSDDIISSTFSSISLSSTFAPASLSSAATVKSSTAPSAKSFTTVAAKSSSLSSRTLAKAEFRVCYLKQHSAVAKEIGKIVFHRAAEPHVMDTAKKDDVPIRSFLNPGWSYTPAIDGKNFNETNILSLERKGMISSTTCAGFSDSSKITSKVPPTINKTEEGPETITFWFGEDFREHKRDRLDLKIGTYSEYNVCFYDDENEPQGLRIGKVKFVADLRDNCLCVAFIIFVLICIFVCGIVISCYAFKHGRLRKQLRRFRLAQQRQEIEGQLMKLLGMKEEGDAEDSSNSPQEVEDSFE